MVRNQLQVRCQLQLFNKHETSAIGQDGSPLLDIGWASLLYAVTAYVYSECFGMPQSHQRPREAGASKSSGRVDDAVDFDGRCFSAETSMTTAIMDMCRLRPRHDIFFPNHLGIISTRIHVVMFRKI